MAKTTKKTIVNVSLEQAQEASSTYAKSSTRLEKIQAKMNEEINKIKSKYEVEITQLQESLNEPYDVLETYAKEQKPTWGTKKSSELMQCIISFRTGTPRVDKSSKMTWPSIVAVMKNVKALKDFVRVKEDVNKEAILACKDEKIITKLKDMCQVTIEQDETFSVDVKKEEVA
jgi:phage host-nuclease inhibitor protein Gam